MRETSSASFRAGFIGLRIPGYRGEEDPPGAELAVAAGDFRPAHAVGPLQPGVTLSSLRRGQIRF
jgi:hypothetical protein